MPIAFCPAHRRAWLAAEAENKANCAKYFLYDRTPNPDAVIKALAEQYKKAYVDGVNSANDLISEFYACAGCLAARRLQPRSDVRVARSVADPTRAPLEKPIGAQPRSSHRHALLAADAENQANCARYVVYAQVSDPDSVSKTLAEKYRKALVDGATNRDNLMCEIGYCPQCFRITCEDSSHPEKIPMRNFKAK